MIDASVLVIALAILLYGLISRRVSDAPVTGPMVFVALGFLLSDRVLGFGDVSMAGAFAGVLAELTLILVLFTDASRIELRLLRREHALPVRLLLIGLPLTILAGTLLGRLLFPAWSVLDAAVLATILAPTDAALGQQVVSNPAVPVRIRQALNIESGLNDGMVLPVLLIVLSLAGATETGGGTGYWVRFAGLQVTLGPLVGVAVGGIGGKLVERAGAQGWMDHSFQNLAALALAFLAYALASLIGGNGFIAAFVAGLTVGNTSRAICTCFFEFGEAEGQLLSLLIFMIFGGALFPRVLDTLDWSTVGYAVLSLTVVRMVPVALSLIGTGVRPATVLFLGWFGPRGLATILFGLLVVEEAHLPTGDAIFSVGLTAVLLSVVAHGATAAPWSRWYGARLARVSPAGAQAERMHVPEMPLRIRR